MEMLNNLSFSQLVCRTKPVSAATLHGSAQHPAISGTIRFYRAAQGTLVVAEVFGLPDGPFHAFHLHEGSTCGSGAGDDPFAGAEAHFNPTGQPHPYHAGDFPPLLSNGGYAYASFYTDRLTPEQAVGHTVIVHANTDDFHTQPSGNAGMKIACGAVVSLPAPRG